MNPPSSRHIKDIKIYFLCTFVFYRLGAHQEQIYSPCLSHLCMTRAYPCAWYIADIQKKFVE